MDYGMAGEHELAQLAQMRWDFRGEDGTEVPMISHAAFLDECPVFLRQGLQAGRWAYWVARHEREVVSHAFVHVIRSVPRPCRLDDGWGYVTNVYTKPDYRNKGIGTELMQRVTSWARAEGLELLLVSPSEESAGFYRRAGFVSETDFLQQRLRAH